MAQHDIRVAVRAQFVPQQSDAEASRFVFAYTITLSNAGTVPAKLLTRHWIITDGNGKVQEVRGEAFRYTSGAVLETPIGAMQGTYQMLADDGTRFDAPIAPFRLAMPGVLN